MPWLNCLRPNFSTPNMSCRVSYGADSPGRCTYIAIGARRFPRTRWSRSSWARKRWSESGYSRVGCKPLCRHGYSRSRARYNALNKHMKLGRVNMLGNPSFSISKKGSSTVHSFSKRTNILGCRMWLINRTGLYRYFGWWSSGSSYLSKK